MGVPFFKRPPRHISIMQFNSLQFLIFIPLVTVGYFAIPHRHRWLLLLAASVYFYMTFTPGDVLTLALVVCVTYLAGAFMEDSDAARKKHILSAAIIVILGLLFYL